MRSTKLNYLLNLLLIRRVQLCKQNALYPGWRSKWNQRAWRRTRKKIKIIGSDDKPGCLFLSARTKMSRCCDNSWCHYDNFETSCDIMKKVVEIMSQFGVGKRSGKRRKCEKKNVGCMSWTFGWLWQPFWGIFILATFLSVGACSMSPIRYLRIDERKAFRTFCLSQNKKWVSMIARAPWSCGNGVIRCSEYREMKY